MNYNASLATTPTSKMSSNVEKALRNKKILDWYRSLPLISGTGAVTRSGIVVAYSKHLQCPIAEILCDMSGDDDLDFIYKNYIKLIEKT